MQDGRHKSSRPGGRPSITAAVTLAACRVTHQSCLRSLAVYSDSGEMGISTSIGPDGRIKSPLVWPPTFSAADLAEAPSPQSDQADGSNVPGRVSLGVSAAGRMAWAIFECGRRWRRGLVAGFPTVDLFAGAGGLSIGASIGGADVRLSVDFDSRSCETLRMNHRFIGGGVLEADVTVLSGRDIRAAAGLGRTDPLLVVGGAPCQAFSKAAYWLEDGDEARYRRARERGEAAFRPVQGPRMPDSRRDLVGEFWRLVAEARADAFVFENVPSILHPRNRHYIDGLLAAAESAGYHCVLYRTNALEHGVPQKRQRVFVLGSKRGRPVAPSPTHSDGHHHHDGLQAPVTAGEALRHVSPFADFEPEEIVAGRWAAHLRDIPPGWNYKFHTAWAGNSTPTFVAETRFWNFLLKLSPGLPSWTLAANPGPWVGPFHWDSRRLRTAELAALQTFPEGYQFAGNRRERVRQIGNAVPPTLAARVVEAVIDVTFDRRRLIA
jgi:DNA (cytosine-5)-methyltransferase 1